MEKLPKNTAFAFESYDVNPETKEVKLNYRLSKDGEDILFTERLVFPPHLKWDNIPAEVLAPALQAVHLISGISYWKAYCPKKIEIKNGSLNKRQAVFWNRVYAKGLGEFFYRNKIDPRGLINFPYGSNGSISRAIELKSYRAKSLLLFGGGKDSLVSAELMKRAKKKFDFFFVASGALADVADKLLPKGSIIVKRYIDPRLIELNKKPGVLNGHIPISMLIAFIAELSALLYGYRYVIFSNEKSADYGNLKYLDKTINHQWSKSLEAEKMVQDYTGCWITKSVTSFSLLRPFHEVKIVELFSRLGRKYFKSFTSCNANFKVFKDRLKKGELWCGHCPKCAFVFAMLSAFLSKKEVLGIFGHRQSGAGKNLFADKSLLPLYRELLGLRKFKPFECVGTPEEMVYALSRAAKGGEYARDLVMRMFVDEIVISPAKLKQMEKKLFAKSKDLIPSEFSKTVKLV
ncbi:MAG: hypothetical protein A3B23_03505 [Candidatus Colwellbacteria bacterium RIFCSPLOWO2_01_FULL_48_10]|uniref:UDP-N-acetyl-alpha-D-muramoyl-L-alanyl-L-glutamate epimerase n=2 Tax=Bacteria candidate phyla TaxID=1783234 RepID=A0A1F5P3W7_9BACT|nr:MAG: hypothetical protein A2846_04520 [Candidatus Doudnabacteria bacterium RIFCSPHIGHO2_01_FULL_49_9]OGY59254.1 MAG: hypothetical protein A3B23_03505 [Candidatus Colwellbacteria bacterium RIFCSPLOWO2_01_FULL_48_10]